MPLLVGLTMSIAYFNQYSLYLSESLQQMAKSLTPLQNQINSLATITLQNQRGLDLLTGKKKKKRGDHVYYLK